MNNEKSNNKDAGFGSSVDGPLRPPRHPFRAHIWRYRWIYFLLFYLPIVIPVVYMSITDADDPLFSESFLSGSLILIWFIATTLMLFLWAFSMFYLMIGNLSVGKKWRWFFALILCPPLVFVYFATDRA